MHQYLETIRACYRKYAHRESDDVGLLNREKERSTIMQIVRKQRRIVKRKKVVGINKQNDVSAEQHVGKAHEMTVDTAQKAFKAIMLTLEITAR